MLRIDLRERSQCVFRAGANEKERLTWAKKVLYGSPPSRAKAQVKRDTEATTPRLEASPTKMIDACIIVVAFIDPVAW